MNVLFDHNQVFVNNQTKTNYILIPWPDAPEISSSTKDKQQKTKLIKTKGQH